MSKYKLGSTFLVIALLATGCSEKKVPQSQEQISHKKSMDYCISLLVEAGATWRQGERVTDVCERQNPTPSQRARLEIMALLAKKKLTPENTFWPSAIPEGDCKHIAEQFVSLHELAFRQDGDAKESTLSKAAVLRMKVEGGSCI